MVPSEWELLFFVQFLFFDVQEFNLLIESVSCCCPYGVVALPVVAVYFNVYVVGR